MNIFILAGGQSSRMKSADKPHLELYQGKTILEFIVTRLTEEYNVSLIVKDKNDFNGYDIKVYEDIKEAGPLGGIYTGLTVTSSPYNFFLGCDMPFLSLKIIKWMESKVTKDGLAPVDEKGYIEPLFAIYNKRVVMAVERAIADRRRRIISFYDDISMEYVRKEKLADLDAFPYHFYNINTPEEYRRAKDEILPEYLQYYKLEDD
ncbi:MAG: molybdenum cofactor guanylyltransferase [Bacillota bacterium]